MINHCEKIEQYTKRKVELFLLISTRYKLNLLLKKLIILVENCPESNYHF